MVKPFSAREVVARIRAVLRRTGPVAALPTSRRALLVGALRRKLGDDPAAPRFVETVRGVGSKLLDAGGAAEAS